jgi:hypothetical protein
MCPPTSCCGSLRGTSPAGCYECVDVVYCEHQGKWRLPITQWVLWSLSDLGALGLSGVICHLAALKVAQGVHNQKKTHLLSWSHTLIESHNSSARRSCPECCSPGRDELPMSMSSRSQPIVLRWAVNPCVGLIVPTTRAASERSCPC